MTESDSSIARAMAKQGKKPANNNAAVRLTMMQGVKGKLREVSAEHLLVNQKEAPVNDATEGFLNDGASEEPEAHAELKEADFTNSEEENGDKEEENEEDGDESVEQVETGDHIRCFFEDDDKDLPRVGCAFDDLCVRVEGRSRYALVCQTEKTGDVIVCAAASLVPCDPDQHGVEDVYLLTCTSVYLMKRGADFHFCFAEVASDEHTDDEGATETIT